MKSFRQFALVTAMTAILAFAFNAGAQQTASSTAGAGYSGQTGDSVNGGWTNGSGMVTAGATDPSHAQTSANVAGSGASQVDNSDPNSVMAGSNALTTAGGNAKGAQTNLQFSTGAQQGDYVGIGSGSTGADGGNTTQGNISGSATDDAPLQGDGVAGAKGMTSGSASGDGTNNASASIETDGSSKAAGDITTPCPPANQQISSGVSGNGAGYTGALAGDPNGSFAGASTGGTAAYNAANPNGSSAGSLKITGNSTGTVSNGGADVTAKANTSASAQAH